MQKIQYILACIVIVSISFFTTNIAEGFTLKQNNTFTCEYSNNNTNLNSNKSNLDIIDPIFSKSKNSIYFCNNSKKIFLNKKNLKAFKRLDGKSAIYVDTQHLYYISNDQGSSAGISYTITAIKMDTKNIQCTTNELDSYTYCNTSKGLFVIDKTHQGGNSSWNTVQKFTLLNSVTGQILLSGNFILVNNQTISHGAILPSMGLNQLQSVNRGIKCNTNTNGPIFCNEDYIWTYVNSGSIFDPGSLAYGHTYINGKRLVSNN